MNERADKAAKEAANSTIPYHNTNLPLDSLLVHLKQKIKHWNNEWKTLVKLRLLTIKNDFYKNVIPPTLKRHDQVVISRIIIGHTKITSITQIHTHQKRATTLRTVQDDPNNRPPHTTMRSIPTVKETT